MGTRVVGTGGERGGRGVAGEGWGGKGRGVAGEGWGGKGKGEEWRGGEGGRTYTRSNYSCSEVAPGGMYSLTQ